MRALKVLLFRVFFIDLQCFAQKDSGHGNIILQPKNKAYEHREIQKHFECAVLHQEAQASKKWRSSYLCQNYPIKRFLPSLPLHNYPCQGFPDNDC